MKIKIIITALLIILASPFSKAYLSTTDTGDILAPDKYRVIAEPQFYSSTPNGATLNGHFDAGISESSQVRASLGFGSVNLFAGATYKWIPIPDYNNQPAVGLLASASFARWNSDNYLGLRFGPLVSKRFKDALSWTDFTPYASLTFAAVSGPSTIYPFQLEVGSDWRFEGAPKWSFMTEIGMNLYNAYSYISLAAAYYFDDNSPVQRH